MKNTRHKPSLFKRILGLFHATTRNECLNEIQNYENFQFVLDRDFCRRETLTRSHSEIGKVFSKSNGQNILEVGCGPGRYAAALGGLGLKVTAVDPYKFEPWEELSNLANIKFFSDVFAENLPQEDESFDNICCFGALLYFDDPIKAISEMNRVLKTGGKLILRTVNKNNNYTKATNKKLDPNSNNLFSKTALENIIERGGFRLIDSYTFGYWPSRFTDLFWYISNCFFSWRFKEKLGNYLPEENRILITVVAVKK
jgi:ubiquinone/menaquinone biosynthesis C-methylase UbiE